MKHNYLIIKGILITAVILIFFTGCLEQITYTGGGWILSTEDDGDGKIEKANFGFVFNGCVDDKDDAYGKFNYRDKAAGVAMNGELVEVITQTMVIVEYRSTMKDSRGETGYAEVSYLDLSEGTAPHGSMQILVLDGPFAGYWNAGIVHGNVQRHECDEEEDL